MLLYLILSYRGHVSLLCMMSKCFLLMISYALGLEGADMSWWCLNARLVMMSKQCLLNLQRSTEHPQPAVCGKPEHMDDVPGVNDATWSYCWQHYTAWLKTDILWNNIDNHKLMKMLHDTADYDTDDDVCIWLSSDVIMIALIYSGYGMLWCCLVLPTIFGND